MGSLESAEEKILYEVPFYSFAMVYPGDNSPKSYMTLYLCTHNNLLGLIISWKSISVSLCVRASFMDLNWQTSDEPRGPGFFFFSV